MKHYFFHYTAMFVLFLIFQCLYLPENTLAAEPDTSSPVLSVTDQGLTVISAQDLELQQIISELETRKGLLFSGLSEYYEKKITLSYTGSLSDIFKKLFKLLDIKNFSFRFDGEMLSAVTVLPSSSLADSPDLEKTSQTLGFQTQENAVKAFNSSTVSVQKVFPDSQGEALELEKDDYIIAYNGHKVQNAGRLIDYVRRYKDEESVSMVIVRDERPAEYSLQGGLIGVQILTVPMSFDVLEGYYREIGLENDLTE